MEEIDDDAHVTLYTVDATCEGLNYVYAKDGVAFPVSGDYLTTRHVEPRWRFND